MITFVSDFIDEKKIIAVIEINQKLNIENLNIYLRKFLPNYMIPKKFFLHSKFKLNQNSENILDLTRGANWQTFNLIEKNHLWNSSNKFNQIKKILIKHLYKTSNFEELLAHKTTIFN